MSITITIDGMECLGDPGEYLADIAERNNINIPMLCGLNKALLGRGCCRICVVEVVESGRSKTVASCIYPVTKPCEVFTNSERIVRERGVILTLLKRLAPDSQMIADMAQKYGAPDYKQLEPQTEGGRCILCGLCVEACKSLGAGAISTVGRGVEKKISTPFDEESPVCVGCGSCAAVCPTKNIPIQTDKGRRVIWGREFKVVHCEICDDVLGTEESLAYTARVKVESNVAATRHDKEKDQTDTESQTLCSKHRRRQVAKGFARHQ